MDHRNFRGCNLTFRANDFGTDVKILGYFALFFDFDFTEKFEFAKTAEKIRFQRGFLKKKTNIYRKYLNLKSH
ncbi:hypothetical protein OA84_02270 [Kaistella solincola]|uniref:Uncharacterized protein n=1 Tax=Kaistella solincola TaxID=510955 RepID=A0ABR4ZSS6_9FLAO|nr:hypothetical protein OA84_02270 [Kaistella solincola]